MPDPTHVSYTEQDTADKLILPYLTERFDFPAPSSLNYQAQHHMQLRDGKTGRYDGLYLNRGFPHAILEAKRYSHDLTEEDFRQAKSYATSDYFSAPVPFLILSNGREHQFFRLTDELDPSDGAPKFLRISPTNWKAIRDVAPGEVKRILQVADLIESLLQFKDQTFNDFLAEFTDASTGSLSIDASSRGPSLRAIIEERRLFIGESKAGDIRRRTEQSIRQALQAISLHFTTKILFIKLIEDLSPGTETPRIIHELFPRAEYDMVGGLFGYKVLNALSPADEQTALRLYAKSKRFYSRMARDIARVEWHDIFRYGFSVHSQQYGKLFKSQNYDKFLPSERTLASIHDRLIKEDIRHAVLYGEHATRTNVIGQIYEQLIDDELRTSLGAIYTPDPTIEFMISLAHKGLGHFRNRKMVEPSCGSGHFYKRLYRKYIDEIFPEGAPLDDIDSVGAAHEEALSHIFGRDIDPFAVQLTLLGTFLEQLKDNVLPAIVDRSQRIRTWSANRAIDTQNSLDPITLAPDRYFEAGRTTRDLNQGRSLLASCKRAAEPDLVIGNPPYGVDVVPGDHYEDVYSLSSKDSYGYFIVNGLRRLREGGRLIFIVSSTFLTISSHLKLREFILQNSKIIRVVKLSRHTFPGIDVFPVVIELERCSDQRARESNFYRFYDLWRLHPTHDSAELEAAYQFILAESSSTEGWMFPSTRSAAYSVRQGLIATFSRKPIFEGKASFYAFMDDSFSQGPPREITYASPTGALHHIRRVNLVRGRDLVKLSTIASVVVGLQSGDNPAFYRKSPIVGDQSGTRPRVDMRNVLTDEELAAIPEDHKLEGIPIDDPSSDRYFVPLDKAPDLDVENGLLPIFNQRVEMYVNWSRPAVQRMKSLSGARFQNSSFYFKKGVTYSSTGLYSPTFRVSHGGVFDQKSVCIFCDVISVKSLLGILSSTLLRYFAKAFINHGVDSQVQDLPIILPTHQESSRLEEIVDAILEGQRNDLTYDYRPKVRELDRCIAVMYSLTEAESNELKIWFERRYPVLTGQVSAEDL